MSSFQFSFNETPPRKPAKTAASVHVSMGHLPMMRRLLSRISASDLYWLNTIDTAELLAMIHLVHTAKTHHLDFQRFFDVHNQRCTMPSSLSEADRTTFPALQTKRHITEGLFPIAQRLCRRVSRNDLHWLTAMETAELKQILRHLQSAKRRDMQIETLVDVHNQTCVN